MRKIFLSLSIIILPLLFLSILIFKGKTTIPQKSFAQSLPSPTPVQENNSITINNLTLTWFEIKNIDNLKLIPNFSQKLSSKEIIDKNNCKFLSSAGFYSEDNKPLGLFIAEGDKLSAYNINNFLDGILSINEMMTPRITRNLPNDEIKIGVQSGPILKENNNFQTLKIKDDKEARRIIAAITGENKLYFITIYDPNSQFSGPLLADLPNLLEQFEEKSKIKFADIVNLDGGLASVFITKSDQLFEANYVGAFFCQP